MNRIAVALVLLVAVAVGVAAFLLGKRPTEPAHVTICAHLVEVGARAASERPRCEFFFAFVRQTFESDEDPLWSEMSGCLLRAQDARAVDNCVRSEIAVLGHVSTFFNEGDGQLFCAHLQGVYCDESLYDCERWRSFTVSSECPRQYAQDLAMTALSMSESRDEFDRRMAAAWACADADEHQEVGACVNDWLVGVDNEVESEDVPEPRTAFATPSELDVCEHTFAVASQEFGDDSVLNGSTPDAWLDECLIGAGLVEDGCANYDEILRCTIQGESVDDFDTCRALCISR